MSLQIPYREKANGATGATKAVILVSWRWEKENSFAMQGPRC